MKRFGWIIAVVLLSLAAACTPKTEKTAITSKEVVAQTQRALDTLHSYLQQQKAVHQRGAEARLQRLDRRIGMLQNKAAKMEGDAKVRLEKQIAAFKGKEEAFKQNLGKMAAAPDQEWEKLAVGIAVGMDDLENEFDKALDIL